MDCRKAGDFGSVPGMLTHWQGEQVVLDNGLLNVLMVYASHSRKPEEEKESLEWNVPFGELYTSEWNGAAWWFWDGDRNTDGSRILEFADGLNLVICNTLFMKQESQLVTYAAGPVKSTVDYIFVRQEDKAKVRNVMVIPNEECVPKHKLLVMDMHSFVKSCDVMGMCCKKKTVIG